MFVYSNFYAKYNKMICLTGNPNYMNGNVHLPEKVKKSLKRRYKGGPVFEP